MRASSSARLANAAEAPAASRNWRPTRATGFSTLIEPCGM